MSKTVWTVCACLGLSAAVAAEMPHWIDIMPLSENAHDPQVADAVFLGNKTISDGIAWNCKLVPEGDPAMDKASVYVRRFEAVAPRVRAGSKVRQGFLIQATIGHGWTPGKPTPWQKIVRSDGNSAYKFCPLGAEFRAYVAAQARTLASAHPDFFMIDDDTKLLCKDVDGCFCPLHLAGFAEKTGRAWTREALVGQILAGDEALAKSWREYVESTLVDYVRLIRAQFPDEVPGSFCTVDGPHARMGFVVPCAKALAGAHARPVVRIGSAPYWSNGLFDILDVRRSVANQLAFLGPSVDVLAEADTCPQVRWQTSATRALDHTTILTAEGCRGAKMWWHRLANFHERKSSSAYLRALSGKSGLLRWLADAGFEADGVWCPADCGQPEWGANVFGRLGIAYRYGAHRPGDVVALTGVSSASLDAATLTNVLSGPVLLDGSAAVALAARGFGDLVGVRAKPWQGRSITFEDVDGVRLFSSQGGSPADLTDAAAGAIVQTRLYNRVSALADEATYLAPGSLWFENRLGGRVVTLSGAVPKEPKYLTEFGYCNETRKAWLVKTLARLGGVLPGAVYYAGDEMLLCEAGRTCRGERVVILDNLDLDEIENPELVFAEAPADVERLSDDGAWQRLPVVRREGGRLVLQTTLKTHRPAILKY